MRPGLIAFAVLIAVPVRAAEPRPGRPESRARVNLELKSVPLRQALERLFENTRLNYGVDSTVADVPISVTLQDVPREAALRTLLRAAESQLPGITYEFSGNNYQVVQKPVKPAAPYRFEEPGADRVVKLQFAGVNLREALRRLVVGTLIRIEVHATVPDVPVEIDTRGATLPEAARAIVRSAAFLVPGLAIRPQGNGYFVWIDDDKSGLAGLPGIIKLGENDYLAKIRVKFEDARPDSYLVQMLQRMLYLRQLDRTLRRQGPDADSGPRRLNTPPRTGAGQ